MVRPDLASFSGVNAVAFVVAVVAIAVDVSLQRWPVRGVGHRSDMRRRGGARTLMTTWSRERHPSGLVKLSDPVQRDGEVVLFDAVCTAAWRPPLVGLLVTLSFGRGLHACPSPK